MGWMQALDCLLHHVPRSHQACCCLALLFTGARLQLWDSLAAPGGYLAPLLSVTGAGQLGGGVTSAALTLAAGRGIGPAGDVHASVPARRQLKLITLAAGYWCPQSLNCVWDCRADSNRSITHEH